MQYFIQGILVPLEGAFLKNGICDSFVENFKDSDFCQKKTPHFFKQFTVRAVQNYWCLYVFKNHKSTNTIKVPVPIF